MNNQVIAFVAELIKRLFAKSPKFFKVIQIISIIVAIVTGLPDFLNSLHIVLPEFLQKLESTTVSIASIVALVIASLTVDKGIGAKEEIKTNDALPFTAKAEKKKVEKIIDETNKQ